MAIEEGLERAPVPVKGPDLEGAHPVWAASAGAAEARFVGRGPGGTRAEILRRVEGRAVAVAQAKQIHSERVLAAHEGFVGQADALWTDRPGLALSVITADCVPLLLAARDGRRVAAVHAGWRGIVAGVVERTLDALDVPVDELDAWIGPAIGVCCYEVGEDVAERVVAAAGPGVLAPGRCLGPERRPHLDLPGAVRRQLVRAGVPPPRVVVRCTRCDGERLWSYRREGAGGGRNVAYVWAGGG
jgi:hypothetical protein